jgi:glutathione S-transferase
MLTLFELCGDDEAVRFSPFVWRIKLMLAHKGIEFDTETITFTNKSALEPSSFKTVPVIRHDGRWINESFAIARYLDETFREKPLFESDSAAVQAVVLNNWVDRNIVAPVFPMLVADIYDALGDDCKRYFRATREPRIGTTIEASREGREEKREAYKANLLPLETILDGHDYLGGSTPAFLDYCVLGSLMWPYVVSHFDPISVSPRLMEWREQMFADLGSIVRDADRAV